MNKDLFQEEKPEEREALLKDNAYHSEKRTVKRSLSREELADLKHEHAHASITLRDMKAELKKFTDEKKAEMKPYEMANKERLDLIKQKYRESEETVYGVADHAEGMMNYYDKEGKFLESRRLLPSELQTLIIPMQREGTND